MQKSVNFKFTKNLKKEYKIMGKEKRNVTNIYPLFEASTTYKAGDRFTWNGETYEVTAPDNFTREISPKEEKGCVKRPFNLVEKR